MARREGRRERERERINIMKAPLLRRAALKSMYGFDDLDLIIIPDLFG